MHNLKGSMIKFGRLVVVCLILVAISGITVSAATVTNSDGSYDDPTIEVGVEEVTLGESVEVDIIVYNNPGITAMGLNVSYDMDKLTLTKVTFNSQLGGYTVGPQKYESPATLTWMIGLSDYKQESFKFATLYFTAKSAGTSQINVSYDKNNIFDLSEENITFDIAPGKVTTVSGGSSSSGSASSESASSESATDESTTSVSDQVIGESSQETTGVSEEASGDGDDSESGLFGISTEMDSTSQDEAEIDSSVEETLEESEMDENDASTASKGMYAVVFILGIAILVGTGFLIYKREFKKK